MQQLDNSTVTHLRARSIGAHPISEEHSEIG